MKRWMLWAVLGGAVGLHAQPAPFDPGKDPGPVIGEFAVGVITGLGGGFWGYTYARNRWGTKVDRYEDPLWRFFSSTASIGGFAIGEAVGSTVGVMVVARYAYGYQYGTFLQDFIRTFGGATLGTILGVFAGASGYDSRSLTLIVSAFVLPTVGAIVGYHWDYFWGQLQSESTTGSGQVQGVRPPTVVVPLLAARF